MSIAKEGKKNLIASDKADKADKENCPLHCATSKQKVMGLHWSKMFFRRKLDPRIVDTSFGDLFS